jgi:hypothetical protein
MVGEDGGTQPPTTQSVQPQRVRPPRGERGRAYRCRRARRAALCPGLGAPASVVAVAVAWARWVKGPCQPHRAPSRCAEPCENGTAGVHQLRLEARPGEELRGELLAPPGRPAPRRTAARRGRRLTRASAVLQRGAGARRASRPAPFSSARAASRSVARAGKVSRGPPLWPLSPARLHAAAAPAPARGSPGSPRGCPMAVEEAAPRAAGAGRARRPLQQAGTVGDRRARRGLAQGPRRPAAGGRQRPHRGAPRPRGALTPLRRPPPAGWPGLRRGRDRD